MDMKINEKKKEVKKNYLQNPPQSYRPAIFMPFDPENDKTDFKSHSLKNS